MVNVPVSNNEKETCLIKSVDYKWLLYDRGAPCFQFVEISDCHLSLVTTDSTTLFYGYSYRYSKLSEDTCSLHKD